MNRVARPAQVIGHSVEHHALIGSTNDRVREMAEQGVREGAVVVADTQTEGRGRLGRRWHDRPGASLLFSVLLRPRLEPDRLPLLGLAAAAACAQGITEATGVDARVKWPNDLVVLPSGEEAPWRARKLGGILLEGGAGFAVLGIGINVTQAPEVPAATDRPPPTSLAQERGRPLTRERLLAGLLQRLDETYARLTADDLAGLLNAWRALDITLGKPVTFSIGGERGAGVARDIAPDGALIVETPDGTRRLRAGEVSIAPLKASSEDRSS